MQNAKYKIQNTKYKIQNTKYKIQNTKKQNTTSKHSEQVLSPAAHSCACTYPHPGFCPSLSFCPFPTPGHLLSEVLSEVALVPTTLFHERASTNYRIQNTTLLNRQISRIYKIQLCCTDKLPGFTKYRIQLCPRDKLVRNTRPNFVPQTSTLASAPLTYLSPILCPM